MLTHMSTARWFEFNAVKVFEMNFGLLSHKRVLAAATQKPGGHSRMAQVGKYLRRIHLHTARSAHCVREHGLHREKNKGTRLCMKVVERGVERLVGWLLW